MNRFNKKFLMGRINKMPELHLFHIQGVPELNFKPKQNNSINTILQFF